MPLTESHGPPAAQHVRICQFVIWADALFETLYR